MAPLEHGLDLCPERLPFLPLGVGELRQGLGVADGGEVGVLLPVAKIITQRDRVGGLDLAGEQGQVARSQSRAWRRRRVRSASSSWAASSPWPAAASTAMQAAL